MAAMLSAPHRKRRYDVHRGNGLNRRNGRGDGDRDAVELNIKGRPVHPTLLLAGKGEPKRGIVRLSGSQATPIVSRTTPNLGRENDGRIGARRVDVVCPKRNATHSKTEWSRAVPENPVPKNALTG